MLHACVKCCASGASYTYCSLLVLHCCINAGLCPGTAQDRPGFPHSYALRDCLSVVLARSRRIFQLLCLPATGTHCDL